MLLYRMNLPAPQNVRNVRMVLYRMNTTAPQHVRRETARAVRTRARPKERLHRRKEVVQCRNSLASSARGVPSKSTSLEAVSNLHRGRKNRLKTKQMCVQKQMLGPMIVMQLSNNESADLAAHAGGHSDLTWLFSFLAPKSWLVPAIRVVVHSDSSPHRLREP